MRRVHENGVDHHDTSTTPSKSTTQEYSMLNGHSHGDHQHEYQPTAPALNGVIPKSKNDVSVNDIDSMNDHASTHISTHISANGLIHRHPHNTYSNITSGDNLDAPTTKKPTLMPLVTDDNENIHDDDDDDASTIHTSNGITDLTENTQHDYISPIPSTNSSSTPSPPSTPSSSMDGLTDDGERFIVPETTNTVNTFLPQNIGLVAATTMILLSASAYTVLFGDLSKWYHIAWFFVWRCGYDIGLGFLLSAQSQRRTVTRWYIKHRCITTPTSVITPPATTWKHMLLDHLARSQLPHDHPTPILEYPVAFRSWLVFKSLVNFILVQDGLNYILLAVKVWKWPHSITLMLILRYVVGIILSVFNLWAKQDAHRCIGSYSWYWGDFFFRKQSQLVFDGIFELFPHPMYTVGYSMYYGLTLLSGSYTLLFVSLTAHALQLAFLFFVEEPHIERTYGKLPATNSHDDVSQSSQQIKLLYNQAAKPDAIFYSSMDMTRTADFALVLITCYTIVLTCVIDKPYYLVIHTLIWRAIHWLVLGTILWLQSTRQWWTRRYITSGRTLSDAFSAFRGIYNLSYTMNLLSFICTAIRYNHMHWYDLNIAQNVAQLVGGCILILLNIWSYKSTLNAVGNFGWFFGDFFIQPNFSSSSGTIQHLCYTGIYRFLNNPDCITGYMGLYGAALICKSWTIFTLALISHGCQLAFLNLVEIPHMNRIYNNKNLRSLTPAIGAIQKLKRRVTDAVMNDNPQAAKLMGELDKAEDVLKQEIKKIRLKASKEILTLYQRIASERKRLQRAMRRKQRQQEDVVNGPLSHENENDDVDSSSEDEWIDNPPHIHSNSSSSHTSPRDGNHSRADILTSNDKTPSPSRRRRSSSGNAGRDVPILSVPDHIPVGEALSVSYKTRDTHSDTDWIGIYSIDVESLPSASEGRWFYVPEGATGKLTFPPSMLPTEEGIYEIRYHRNNKYRVAAAKTLIIHSPNTEHVPLLISPRNLQTPQRQRQRTE